MSRRLPLSLLLIALAGCTVGPDFVRPELAADADYTQQAFTRTALADIATGGAAQRLIAGMDIPGQWWTLFRSPELNALVEEALRANPDVSAAQAALRQANELVYADQASLFPSVGANLSKTREKVSGASTGAASAPILTLSSASLNVSYAPDVFGGTRRQIESSTAQAQYQRFALEATYLTLSTNVVNTAVNLASLRDQIAATGQIVQLQSDQLDLLQAQRRLGAIADTDVLTQQTALAQTRATLAPLQKQLAQTRNQLMAYLGRFPNQDKGERFNLASLHLPQELPVSLPSALVSQRPDVRAAEAQLHEASANIGVAVANQLPQFSITGSLGSTVASGSTLFSAGSGVWSLAGAIAQPLFDAGALEHRKRAAVAAYDQSAAQYRGTVITAFQDVANVLRALEADAEALKQQVAAERSAQASLALVQAQYRLGAVAYINLLTAQQTYQNTVLTRVQAQAVRYSDSAALFQALGGGWWNRRDVDPGSKGHPDRFGLPTREELMPAHNKTMPAAPTRFD
ncbi:efflux transporter outer membrane subunit [Pseudomonas fragi]|jgi:NodT family efflux transporter outer membrane factor (OMF) lipoprotein|uniref:Efflux transporter outer membrane subunit n=1 Tax=Pseudomonas fragi TaxID=296 RepID=A0A9Q5FNA8_PSEFR|nr:efflux transporter outer membrane subunit [Pseudomonas fragi]MBM1198221.1 efflux transporter outer membrane subunit [Pseudomonas fragi]NNB27361.1 efflux transporter outer membrane subunit [Pseudomonas fragi]NNB34831.1 efflux transporter outer membrane subunit [Pseudomonas fragi]NNB49205.1 efflux transporter outer membrane subunit [Pseudomonas fragi]NNB57107.1 efflux transporter outer membrane subunit [Pseudomonas fragi]